MRKLKYAVVCLTVAVLVASAGQVQAGIIYDESISGDSGDSGSPSNLGILSGSENVVLGTLDAGTIENPKGPDEQDFYAFTTTNTWTVVPLSLDFNNTNGLFISLYIGSSYQTGYFLRSTTDSFGIYDAGTYSLALVPEGNTGQVDYSFSINVAATDNVVVPEPASMALWALGSLGIGVIARRRKRKQTELAP